MGSQATRRHSPVKRMLNDLFNVQDTGSPTVSDADSTTTPNIAIEDMANATNDSDIVQVFNASTTTEIITTDIITTTVIVLQVGTPMPEESECDTEADEVTGEPCTPTPAPC